MRTKIGSVPADSIFDPELPGTRLLRRPKQLGELLLSAVPNSAVPGATLRDVKVTLRHHVRGGRCVAEVALVFDHNGSPPEIRRLMIRLYPGDKGADVYETLRQLRSHGFATGSFTVPQPLAYDPARHLLVLEWTRGDSLRSLLRTGKDAFPALERASQWLLRLHTSGANGGRRYDLGRHLHTLGTQGRNLAKVLPAASRLYHDVLRGVEQQGAAMSAWKPAPTHRDFTPEHLLFDGERVTGLDFDEFCQYDPMFDLAHFLAHLRLVALISPETAGNFDLWAAHFERSYRAGAADYSARRIRFYLACAYLKLAYVIGVAQRPRNWDRLALALLREAQRFVKGGQI